MRIGDVATSAGVSVRSLRYYEEQGLISADRSSSGQRVYSQPVVDRVRLIQQFFAAGLPSRAIVEILPALDSGVTTSETLDVLVGERARIAATIADLSTALDHLDVVIEHAGHSTTHAGSCVYAHASAS